jgi:hypothetical protein
MLAVLIWWVVDARRWFTGPVVNVEHAIHHVELEPEVSEGIEPDNHGPDETVVPGKSVKGGI